MSDISLLNKLNTFHRQHCYQYQRRLDTLKEDMERYHFTQEMVDNISLDDITFRPIDTKLGRQDATKFIERYEWMGTIGSFPTHWFGAYYKDIMLMGVVIMSMPNAFSKILGEDTRKYERLIARGASHSLAPKNLGSKFVMWCIKWMVQNTQYRLFTAYSDPACAELGTIYQSLNFYYLGRKSGDTMRCMNPYKKGSVVSSRAFRARSFYKRYAKDLGIKWQPNWCNDQSMLWENIPDDIEQKLREYSKKMFAECEKITFPSKHKYAFVLGRDKRETKHLRKLLESTTKTFDYPKDRGK